MRLLGLLLCLVTAPQGVLSQLQLQESGPGFVKPSHTLSLTCSVSGHSITTDSCWDWIRQKPGKGMEWIGCIRYDGTTFYSPSLSSRISISRDTAKNQFSMQLSSVTNEDTALYYCARENYSYSYGMDYWGKGTQVTVSSGTQSSPNLFPLISCEDPLSDESPVAMGCLAKDFLPTPVTFSWIYQNNSAVNSQAFYDFPSVFREGKYAASSQLLLSSADILQGTDEFVTCKVKHFDSNENVKVPLRGSPSNQPPNVSVFIPTRGSFNNGPRTSKLICQATNFSPKKISVSWLQEGKLLTSGFTTDKVEVDNKQSRPVTYKVTSMLTITESDWLNQNVFTCQVEHNQVTLQKNMSSICGSSTSTIKIFAIPPSFASIFLTKIAKLSCLVTDLATYDSLTITWSRQNGEELKTHTNISESHPNSTFSATGWTTVCVEDWETGDEFTCTVTHTDLPSPLKHTVFKPKGGHKQMPSVYVLPPSREQLSLRESASVTCLVKSFSPADVSVQWMQRGQPVAPETYVTSAPMPEPQAPGLYFVHSILTVSEEDWSAGETYTCVVAHEALPHSVTERTVDKSTGKPTLYNVSLVMSDLASTCH